MYTKMIYESDEVPSFQVGLYITFVNLYLTKKVLPVSDEVVARAFLVCDITLGYGNQYILTQKSKANLGLKNYKD